VSEYWDWENEQLAEMAKNLVLVRVFNLSNISLLCSILSTWKATLLIMFLLGYDPYSFLEA